MFQRPSTAKAHCKHYCSKHNRWKDLLTLYELYRLDKLSKCHVEAQDFMPQYTTLEAIGIVYNAITHYHTITHPPIFEYKEVLQGPKVSKKKAPFCLLPFAYCLATNRTSLHPWLLGDGLLVRK